MAIEIQMAQMRLQEATSARDSAVQRLASAYDSIKQKAQQVVTLTTENSQLEQNISDLNQKLKTLEESIKQEVERRLNLEIVKIKQSVDEEFEARIIGEFKKRYQGELVSGQPNVRDGEGVILSPPLLSGPASAPVSLSPTPSPYFPSSDTDQASSKNIASAHTYRLHSEPCFPGEWHWSFELVFSRTGIA